MPIYLVDIVFSEPVLAEDEQEAIKVANDSQPDFEEARSITVRRVWKGTRLAKDIRGCIPWGEETNELTVRQLLGD